MKQAPVVISSNHVGKCFKTCLSASYSSLFVKKNIVIFVFLGSANWFWHQTIHWRYLSWLWICGQKGTNYGYWWFSCVSEIYLIIHKFRAIEREKSCTLPQASYSQGAFVAEKSLRFNLAFRNRRKLFWDIKFFLVYLVFLFFFFANLG